MDGFKDNKTAWQALNLAFKGIKPTQLNNVNICYAYCFTDLNWYCTIAVKDSSVKLVEQLLPEAEIILNMTSQTFHQVMTGKMNVMYAHLTNKVKVSGSLNTLPKLQGVVEPLCQSYQAVVKQIEEK